MKTLFIFLLALSYQAQGQSDFFTTTQRDTLRPIQSEVTTGYGRYGATAKTQYMYDGLDVRHAKDLGKYIIASGDADAIHEFSAYMSGRHAGGWLIAAGVGSTLTGLIMMASNGPGSDGKFTTQQTITCPTGYACAGTAFGSKTVYGGGVGYQTVEDTPRKNAYYAGSSIIILGAMVLGAGWLMQLPGKHVRRAVQYYNKSLKQQGVSWKMTPYSTVSHSGIGLVGRF